MDEIRVSGLKAHVFVGATEKERSKRQILLLDLTMYVDCASAASSDDLTYTVDYKKVTDAVLSMLRQGTYRLIEKVAWDTADCCLSFVGVRETSVTVRKPGALKNADFAACTVRRAKER